MTETAMRFLGGVAGVAPGVFHRFGEKSAHLPDWHRRLLLFAIPVLSAIVAAMPWMLRDELPDPYCIVCSPAFAVVALVAMACVWVKPPPSAYTRDTIRCVLSYWLIVLLWQVYALARALNLGCGFRAICHSNDFHLQVFYLTALVHFEGLVIFGWTAWMMVRRVRELEDSSSMATRHAGTLVCSMAAAFQVATTFDAIRELSVLWHLRIPYLFILPLLSFFTFQGIWVFNFGVLARILAKNVALVRREMFKVTGAPRAEATWACRVLFLELTATVLLGITTSVTSLGTLLAKASCWDEVALRGVFVLHRVDLVLNALAVAVLSGLLGQVGKPRLDEEPSSGDLSKGSTSREDTMLSGGTDLSAASLEDWARKVEELAGRGVQMGDLLDLWARLLAEPGLMPGFDPRRSTTNDVVRRVVIPLSRDSSPVGGGQALASLWSGGNPREARCMVTHNWSNLFWHLVAAIVADCLGEEDEYSGTAEKLLSEQGTEELRKILEAKGAMDQTYWVCAFSINQHAGICNSFGPPPHPDDPARREWEDKRRDTATKEVHPLCGCEQRKVFNNEAALCEMNKFDDMMRLLSTRVERFSHLVVVDAQFDVFHRAWCVAEIVESHRSGIPQHIMIHSQEVLDLHYLSLSMLDVRDCKASRKEDRDMILTGIADIDRFNCELQWAIFGTKGLFKKWVDGQDRSALIGRILRRARNRESMAPHPTSRRLCGCLRNGGSADGGKAADLLEEGSLQGAQPAQSLAANAMGEPAEDGGADLESSETAHTRRRSEA